MSGVDTADPINGFNTNTVESGSSLVTACPVVTTDEDDCLVLHSIGSDGIVDDDYAIPPADTASLWTHSSSDFVGGGGHCRSVAARGSQASAGNTTNGDYSVSTSFNDHVIWAIAVNADAGGGGGSDTIVAEAGSYTVTGNAADTLHDRNLVAEAGSFALSGLPAATAQGYSSAAEAGAYSLTGGDADFQRDHVMAAEAGGYAVTGLDAATTADVEATPEETGWTLAGAGTSLGGGSSWTNPGNITADDGSIASSIVGEIPTALLLASNFGFALPPNATVLGYEVRVQVRENPSDGGQARFRTLRLYENGGAVGDNKDANTSLTTSYVDYDFGGSEDTFSISLSGAQVNASGFGVVMDFEDDSGGIVQRVEVDAVWMNVHFLDESASVEAEAGTYVVTGLAAGFARAHVLEAAAGDYNLAGLAAVTSRGALLTAEAGAYVLTGNPAETFWDRLLTAEAGAYALTGLDADLLTKLIAEPGVYLLDGLEVATLWDRALIAALGDYTLTGLAAETAPAFGIVAAPGSYLLTGLDAELRHFKVAAELGLYTIDGLDAGLSYNRFMAVDAGAYVVSGLTVAFLGGEYWSDAGAAGGAWSEAGEAGGLWTDANPSGTSWN